MSFSSSGSFSFRTTAAVVCLENPETHPCVTLERRRTAATCAVASTNSRAAVVRKASVSAQVVRPPMRRARSPAGSSEPSSKRRAGLAALPTNRCCACKVTRAVTDGHRRYIELRPALPPRRADLVEAVAAVDGAAHGGREGDLGGLAALGADDFVELLGATGASNVAVDRPAVGTAGRLVVESLRGVGLVLTDGEDEVETTVTARQSLVAAAHGESPLFCLWISEVSPERSVALDPTFPGAIIASAKAFWRWPKDWSSRSRGILQPWSGRSSLSRTNSCSRSAFGRPPGASEFRSMPSLPPRPEPAPGTANRWLSCRPR